jgi:hypothetical protein
MSPTLPVAIAFTSIPLRITRFAFTGQVVNDYLQSGPDVKMASSDRRLIELLMSSKIARRLPGAMSSRNTVFSFLDPINLNPHGKPISFLPQAQKGAARRRGRYPDPGIRDQ